MHRPFLIIAASFCALAVILGAFGAHGLKQVLSAKSLLSFETGVRYHFLHSFALLATGIIYERFKNKWIIFGGYSFIIGIILFSGSLYLLSILNVTNTVGLKQLGIITPFGGLFFIAGWILLLIGFTIKNPSHLKPI